MYSNKILWFVNSGNSPLYTIIESQIPYVSATMVPNILKPNQKGEIQLIRYADKDKDRTICIRLKENAHQQNVAGKISIIITSEKCTQ